MIKSNKNYYEIIDVITTYYSFQEYYIEPGKKGVNKFYYSACHWMSTYTLFSGVGDVLNSFIVILYYCVNYPTPVILYFTYESIPSCSVVSFHFYFLAAKTLRRKVHQPPPGVFGLCVRHNNKQ